MQGWFDLGHAMESVGDSMIKSMLVDEVKPVGVELSIADWEGIRQRWIDSHERYCIERSDDVEWLRGLIRDASGNGGE